MCIQYQYNILNAMVIYNINIIISNINVSILLLLMCNAMAIIINV